MVFDYALWDLDMSQATNNFGVDLVATGWDTTFRPFVSDSSCVNVLGGSLLEPAEIIIPLPGTKHVASVVIMPYVTFEDPSAETLVPESNMETLNSGINIYVPYNGNEALCTATTDSYYSYRKVTCGF
jgi:hypothetical protein